MKRKLRYIILAVVWIFVATHFIKDITQDILKVSTPLDLLGDVKEDLTSFPTHIQQGFYSLGIVSFLAEAFLLISIPVVYRKKTTISLEKSIYIVLIMLFLYFVTAILLDPRFRIS